MNVNRKFMVLIVLMAALNLEKSLFLIRQRHSVIFELYVKQYSFSGWDFFFNMRHLVNLVLTRCLRARHD